MNTRIRSIMSVVSGLLAIFITGLILFPVLGLIVEKFFSMEDGYSMNRLIIDASGFLWIGIAAFTGGYVSSAIAGSRTIFHSFITGVIAFTVSLILDIIVDKHFGLENVFMISSLFFFALIGGMIQKYFYIRKHKDV